MPPSGSEYGRGNMINAGFTAFAADSHEIIQAGKPMASDLST